MTDETRVLPFKRPGERVRLARPSKADRAEMVDAALTSVQSIEDDEDAVGFAVVVLYDDGKRMDSYGATRDAYPQLARVMRRTAADIARTTLQD